MMNQTITRNPFSPMLEQTWKEDEQFTLLGLIFILNALDAIATLAWLQLGIAREANPMMDTLIAFHPVSFVIAKMTLVGLGVALLARYRDRFAARLGAGALFMGFSLLICYHVAGGILLG